MAGVLLPDGSHPYLTKRWREYSGLSVGETDSEGWRRAAHPEDIDSHVEKFRAAAAARKPFENEVRLRRAADGEYRWFLVRISPLCDGRGNIVKWHGVLTDIEDRKRAEQALKRSEAYLAEAQELTKTGSWARDTQMPTRFSRSIKAHLLRHAINEQVTRRVRPASCNACRQVTQLETVDDAGGKSEIVLGAAPKLR